MKKHENYGYTSLPYGRRILLLALIFVVAFVLAGFTAPLIQKFFPADSQQFYISLSVVQNIICFCATALLTALFISTKPTAMLGLNRGISGVNILGIILVFAVGLPLMNQVIYWNSEFHFPSTEIESLLRNFEEVAASQTSIMLSGTSIEALIIEVLTIGVLTGFSEELLFRGTIQRVISSNGLNHHLAIWIAAIIFSAAHFQFYGFIPRLLLGAFFGYIFFWTGSIWVSALAHAINNSVYVIQHWLELRGVTISEIDAIGVSKNSFPVFATISAVAVIIILSFCSKYFFNRTKR